MGTLTDTWRSFLNEEKVCAKDTGKISGDSDLAEIVSDILEENGRPRVTRGAVNHWLTGKRPPLIPQFIALCQALGTSPAAAMSGDRGAVFASETGRLSASALRVARAFDAADEHVRDAVSAILRIADGNADRRAAVTPSTATNAGTGDFSDIGEQHPFMPGTFRVRSLKQPPAQARRKTDKR